MLNRTLPLALFLAAIVSPAAAGPAELLVSPAKCVAMRKGQTCYQNVRFKFQTPGIGDYCLFSNASRKPITCWIGARSGEYKHLMASDQAIEFSLMDSNSKVFASATVNVAWVYKETRKRSRWRLF